MLHESANLQVSTGDGVATVRLSGPTLAELAAAVRVVADTPGLEAVVFRGRFAPGWDADPISWNRAGQRLTRAVANLSPVTVAFVEGPCRGPALELALACDRRLAVAGPDSWVGFPDGPPCWGGSARLPGRFPLGDQLTAREAVRAGLFDDACSARRGGVELQLLLDRLRRRPHKRPQPRHLDWYEAAERRTARLPSVEPAGEWAPLPATVGLVGPGLGAVAGELALRGTTASGDTTGADAVLAEALGRGRCTPLEHEQAIKRLTTTDPARADWTVSTVGPAPARPGRLLTLPSADVPGWLRRAGVVPTAQRQALVLPSPFEGEGGPALRAG